MRSRYGRIPRIDLPLEEEKDDSNENSHNTHEDIKDDGVHISWEGRNSWLWTDFAPRFCQRAEMLGFSNTVLFPKACTYIV